MAGLTQQGLAARAHVRQPLISRIETGREQPSLPTLRRLISACGYSLTLGLVALPEPTLSPDVQPSSREDVRAAVAAALDRR